MDIFMELKNNVLEIIKEQISLFDPFESVYLFGSAINPNLIYHDIDILIIYTKYSQEIEDSLQKVSDKFGEIIDLPIDLTALSVQEEQDTAFLEKIEPHYLKIKIK